MMILAFATALWLGILTSVSPCPLATNVAAISYIARHVDSPGRTVLHGISYTLGRTFTYLGLSVAVIAGTSSIPEISNFLQSYMNKILGPILILAGMVLLDLIHFEMPSLISTERLKVLAENKGIGGSCLLGMLFALSLCPVAAALFFGGLIPLAVNHGSLVAMPSLYGAGTALPVAIFALIVAFWAGQVGKVFDRLGQIENWARTVTGIIFIAIGIYYSLAFIFEVI